MPHHPGEEEPAEDVRHQHGGPQAQHLPQRFQIALRQQGQDGRQGVFRKQLLPPQHDQHEPHAVTEFAYQGTPGRFGQMGAQKPLRHQGEPDCQPRRQPGPCQPRRRAIEVVLALLSNGLVDDMRPDGAMLFRLLALLRIKVGRVVAGAVFRFFRFAGLVLCLLRRACHFPSAALILEPSRTPSPPGAPNTFSLSS